MPRVPQLSEDRVNLSPMPGFRQSVNATEESFGGGPSGAAVGAAAADLAELGSEIAFREQRKANELAVQEADTRASELQIQAEQEAGALLGKDAIRAPDVARDRWSKGLEGITKSLTHPQQRRMFDQLARQRGESLHRSVQVHMAGQIKKYDEDSTKASLVAARNEAAGNPYDDRRVHEALQRQDAVLRAHAARNGLSEEHLAVNLSEARSKTRLAVINKMMLDGQVDRAEAYAKEYASELTPNDAAALTKLQASARRQQSVLKNRTEAAVAVAASRGELGLDELEQLALQGNISREFFTSARTQLLKVQDDPSVPAAEKARTYLALLDAFTALDGVEIDDTGQVVHGAQGNDLTKLQDFRRAVLASASHLTPTQTQFFLTNVQKDFTADRQTKLDGWKWVAKVATSSLAVGAIQLSRLAQSYWSRVSQPNMKTDAIQKAAQGVVKEATLGRSPSLMALGEDEPLPMATATAASVKPNTTPQGTVTRGALRMRDQQGRTFNIPENRVAEAIEDGLMLVETEE